MLVKITLTETTYNNLLQACNELDEDFEKGLNKLIENYKRGKDDNKGNTDYE